MTFEQLIAKRHAMIIEGIFAFDSGRESKDDSLVIKPDGSWRLANHEGELLGEGRGADELDVLLENLDESTTY